MARLVILVQLLCAGIVLSWLAERLGAPVPDARAAGSVLLLLSLLLLTASVWLAARQEVGLRRALFAAFAVSAAFSSLAQLHNVVRYVLLAQ